MGIDSDAQWEPLVAQLRPLLPELMTLGDYNPDGMPDLRFGSDVSSRALCRILICPKTQPLLYICRNVSRQTLRAVEECPDSLKPIVELQYPWGAVWTQRNGRDWTVEAFLVSKDGGFGLDVAKDRNTRRSMLGALAQLAVTPLTRLTGKRLEEKISTN